MKKALLYDPYVDTLGGGERYVLSFANTLVGLGYDVTLAWKDEKIIHDAKERFNLDLSGVKVDPDAYQAMAYVSGIFHRREVTKAFDLVFWVSDGSLPSLFGKKNYIHFQVPFKKIGGNPVTNFLKSAKTTYFIYNSRFTSNIVRTQLPGSRSVILYPPIDTQSFVPGKKENVILSVARFDSPSHAKRQDVLIDTFERFHENNKDVKLTLAGGVKGEAGEELLNKLKARSSKLPITFVVNPKFEELKKLYSKAKVFWHAAGYGIDETEEPEKVEHFGMTTVEAMSAGVIPVVIDKGGQREIITDNTGFLCRNLDDMVTNTIKIFGSKELSESMSQEAIKQSANFSVSSFNSQVESILNAK